MIKRGRHAFVDKSFGSSASEAACPVPNSSLPIRRDATRARQINTNSNRNSIEEEIQSPGKEGWIKIDLEVEKVIASYRKNRERAG